MNFQHQLVPGPGENFVGAKRRQNPNEVIISNSKTLALAVTEATRSNAVQQAAQGFSN